MWQQSKCKIEQNPKLTLLFLALIHSIINVATKHIKNAEISIRALINSNQREIRSWLQYEVTFQCFRLLILTIEWCAGHQFIENYILLANNNYCPAPRNYLIIMSRYRCCIYKECHGKLR